MDLPVPSVGEVHRLLRSLQENLDCPICLDLMKEPVSTICGHIFCRFCILKLLDQRKYTTLCPLCSAKITKRSLRADICVKEIIRRVLETIRAFERDIGVKYSDDLCHPKKVIEVASASSTSQENLIVNSVGYRDRSNYMKKEEKRNTDLGNDFNLQQYRVNERTNFLRKKSYPSNTIVWEIDKEHNGSRRTEDFRPLPSMGSASSEVTFQEENMIKCFTFESSSSSLVDKDCIMNQSQRSCHIEHTGKRAKNEPHLYIDIYGPLEEKNLGSRDDTKTVNESIEIVEGNMTVKQQQDVSFLDSCIEQPGFSYLQDDRSSSFCRMTQVQWAAEAMNMNTNEQIDNGKETLPDQPAGNLSVVCEENKECQLQSQTMPDVCLSKSSGGERIQDMNKISGWFSQSKEILSSNSLVDGCSEELFQDPDSSNSLDSEISQPQGKIFVQKRMPILDLNDFIKRHNVKANNEELVRKREDPVLENSDQTFAVVEKTPVEQREAAFSKIALVEEAAVSMLKGDGDKQVQRECHMLPELNLTDMKHKSSYLNKRNKELIKPLDKLEVLNKSPKLSEETKKELDIKEQRKMNQDQNKIKWNRKLQLFTKKARRQSESTKRKINLNERELKQSISFSEIMPSSSVAEDDFCVLQKKLKKAKFCSDTNRSDKLHLCNVDMGYDNRENFTEETAGSHKANSQDRNSPSQFHPGKADQAVSKDKQVMMDQLEKFAASSEIIQSDGICTDSCAELMSCASEATTLEDSLGQFSQGEILNTQQRNAMQNNLKQLQQKMAIIEAVLKKGSQSVGSERGLPERERNYFKREQTETRIEMPYVLEKSVPPLAYTRTPSERNDLLLNEGQEMSLVASGLNKSELDLVHKFARKTKSNWSNRITEQTTHLIMKTDEDLVCDRTLKYFIGIAAKKWVLSYKWIIQSFETGRILNEEDFEVRGDKVTGKNHQGPKRARESPTRKIFQGMEICCYGPFTDMLPEQLEWIVELCGASIIKQPHLFEHATDFTAVIVVEPDAWTEEITCQKLPSDCIPTIVSCDWVLDSVSSYQCKPFKYYSIPKKLSSISK
ncbi:breast cancer type 1 susceptibility protein isoform X2 [Erythrolamprus reginae]|uniref:breast cancer type 1 susceptibility protein isoform X2 n=1 Tax=Erythrolamprus reginae TaxID=121349 RepID=UPI00396C81ED